VFAQQNTLLACVSEANFVKLLEVDPLIQRSLLGEAKRRLLHSYRAARVPFFCEMADTVLHKFADFATLGARTRALPAAARPAAPWPAAAPTIARALASYVTLHPPTHVAVHRARSSLHILCPRSTRPRAAAHRVRAAAEPRALRGR
jgi:hypothetical protein